MFIHTTIIKVNPENVNAVSEVLFSEKIRAFYKTITGFQHGYLTESVEEPGKLISLSFWDSSADAQRAMSDPAYAGLIGDMRKFLIAPPERYGYQALKEVKKEDLR
jgi:heme-degrading monooxygenase HmoA